MKKILFIILWLSSYLTTFAASWPKFECTWLPWCESWDNLWQNWIVNVIWNFVSEVIKYVAVIAVIALMYAWIMYMLSAWEEEKTKKAKKWITWSLIAVFISISWYFLINAINNANITL